MVESSKLALRLLPSQHGASHQCMNCGHQAHTSSLMPAPPPWAPQEPLEGMCSAWSVFGTKLWSFMRAGKTSCGAGGEVLKMGLIRPHLVTTKALNPSVASGFPSLALCSPEPSTAHLPLATGRTKARLRGLPWHESMLLLTPG